jgi:nucleotide-binding universal stress UspA family protein
MLPPRVVLAAVDFSEPSRVALNVAARLAIQSGASLHVLHAEDPLLASAARAAGVELASETRGELQAFVQSAVPAGRLAAPALHVVTGPPVETLCDIAQREKADVVVMGVHGMSGAERALFGSTTEGVLRKADVSVLVVPATWTPPRAGGDDLSGVGPVVAAVDLAEPSIEAATAACRLAALLGTSVDAVHVVPALPALGRWSSHAETAVQARLTTARSELAAALQNRCRDVPLRLRVETGRVAEQLAAAVAPGSAGHPILVLGRRTRADRGGAPGSTAYRVLATADVPVLMVLPEP